MSNSRVLNDVGLNDNKQNLHEDIPKATALQDFLALIKIGIVNSNVITAFTGIWLALHFTGNGFLNHLDIILFTLLGTSFIIAGSCVINNYIDRDIDPLMNRTKSRPTVTGKFSNGKVLFLGTAFIVIGTIFLLFTTLSATILGLIGVFSYICLYTLWSKRYFVSNTVIGSISGATPPLIGWAAVDPNLDIIAWCLFLIMFIWQPPHFYALAMRKVEDYRAAKIPMLPVVRGFKVTKHHMVIWVAALIPIPFLLSSLGIPFVILASILNIGWLLLGLYGYRMKDDLKWARLMFIYSLQYLTIIFVAMVLVTFI